MIRNVNISILVLLNIFLLKNCKKNEVTEPKGFETTVEDDSINFAVIGDFGKSGLAEKAVADMVDSWNPDFIITTGDNNYYEGKYSTITENITQYYGDYIYNYDAPDEYQCKGKAFRDSINRFFPSPGNHDANNSDQLAPYLNFFTLPGQENYYKFVWGPVSFFSLDSETGNLKTQKSWLFKELDSSQTAFNIVYFHHSPWSNGFHGNNTNMQWDFYNHNVDVIFAGHDHIYSRIEKKNEKGMYYVVNGLGGCSLYNCIPDALPSESFNLFCYDENYGAIKARADNNCLEIKFYSISNFNSAIDSISICK